MGASESVGCAGKLQGARENKASPPADTGKVTKTSAFGTKRLELLHEVMPAATEFAVLVNPTSPANAQAAVELVKAAAGAIGLKLQIFEASTEPEFDKVFAELARQRISGLVIANDIFFGTRGEQLAAAAMRYSVPAIHQWPDFTAAGGLMSYGGSLTDAHRQAGIYIGRILKGEKPGDLPIVLSSKVELFINLKTAKTLRVTIPLALLGRADGIVE
jgi:putative ABC transport system substrate-binding protein